MTQPAGDRRPGERVHLAPPPGGLGTERRAASRPLAANVNDTLMFERLFRLAHAVMVRVRTAFADKGYDVNQHRSGTSAITSPKPLRNFANMRAGGVPIGADRDPTSNGTPQTFTKACAEFLGGPTSVLIHSRSMQATSSSLDAAIRPNKNYECQQALIWTAVPVEYCTPAMSAFRAGAEVLRASDNAEFSWEGLPRSDHPTNPTMQHWQAGGAVLFGYSSLQAMKRGRRLLDRVYVARSGRLAVRDPP